MSNSQDKDAPVGARVARTFVGPRLELARSFKGLTLKDVATKAFVSWGLIGHYEHGRKQPSPDTVAALSRVLDVEPGFFYEPIDDVWQEEQCSFRHRRSTPESVKRRARAHGTLIGLVINELVAYAKFPAYDIPLVPARTAQEIEVAAERCRQRWGVGIGPITHVGRLAEKNGVVLVQHLEHADTIDAFARRGRYSTIVLNTARTSTSRWIYDIAHELGHFVLHDGVETGSKETEEQANYFAGALLLPKKTFSHEFRSRPFSWTHMFELKKRWRCSVAAIIRRAYNLGLIDALMYRRCYQYMSVQGWLKQEPHEPPFVGPEWIHSAFDLAATKGQNAATLCAKLHLTPQAFLAITSRDIDRKKPVPFRASAPRASK